MLSLVVLVLIFSTSVVFADDCKEDSCTPDQTCCSSDVPGIYTCCPFENGVCCEDVLHCCPEGTQCNVLTESCIPDNPQQIGLSTLQLDKRLGMAHEEAVDVESIPDSCKPGETCCPTGTPEECNCCPYSNAVCCEGSFCCPENYECDVYEGVCNPKETIARIEKRHGPLEEEINQKQQCSDGSECSSDATCCPIGGGKSACCPHADATCCPDKVHCCPEDTTCDTTSRYCVRRLAMSSSFVTESALPIDFEDSP